MSDYDIHSCGYYCDRHACILRQRDELRDKLFSDQAVKTFSGGKPNYTQPDEAMIKRVMDGIPDMPIKAKIEKEPTIDGWPLYSGLPSPKSEWHELTDNEIASIKSKYGFGVNIFSFMSAVRELETWLKERNSTSERNVQTSDNKSAESSQP
jgi:hypothetical protein